MSSGLKIAAAYSLPSFALGFCGPQDTISRRDLLNLATGKKVSERKIREIFEKFESAYPYYRLIAQNNKISDPLDRRIVKAFWVGNRLLEKVNQADLQNLILTDFCEPGLLTKQQAKEKAAKVPKGAIPHHSFHVLFLGAVSGRVQLKGAMLDLCRTGWGVVGKVGKDRLTVRYKPLVLGKKIRLGVEIEKEIEFNEKIVPKVKTGDWISFHWAQACEVLTPTEVKNLEYYTQRTVDLVNAPNR